MIDHHYIIMQDLAIWSGSDLGEFESGPCSDPFACLARLGVTLGDWSTRNRVVVGVNERILGVLGSDRILTANMSGLSGLCAHCDCTKGALFASFCSMTVRFKATRTSTPFFFRTMSCSKLPAGPLSKRDASARLHVERIFNHAEVSITDPRVR